MQKINEIFENKAEDKDISVRALREDFFEPGPFGEPYIMDFADKFLLCS